MKRYPDQFAERLSQVFASAAGLEDAPALGHRQALARRAAELGAAIPAESCRAHEQADPRAHL